MMIFRLISKISDISQLFLIVLMHFLVYAIVWTTYFTDENFYKLEYILSLVHFLFFIIVLILFYVKKSHHSSSIKLAAFALIAFFILNAIPMNIQFDSWLGNSYQDGQGWPFTFYEFNPFNWVRSDFPEVPLNNWTINNLFGNLYFASVLIGFAMLLVNKKMDKNNVKPIN